MRTSALLSALTCLTLSIAVTSEAWAVSKETEPSWAKRASYRFEKIVDRCESTLGIWDRFSLIRNLDYFVVHIHSLADAHLRYRRLPPTTRPSFAVFYNQDQLERERKFRARISDKDGSIMNTAFRNDVAEAVRREGVVKSVVGTDFELIALRNDAYLYQEGRRKRTSCHRGNVVVLKDGLVVGIGEFKYGVFDRVFWLAR